MRFFEKLSVTVFWATLYSGSTPSRGSRGPRIEPALQTSFCVFSLKSLRYAALGRSFENAGHEIAGHENTGHEFARHDKYRIKIDYITLECAFLLNFIFFV